MESQTTPCQPEPELDRSDHKRGKPACQVRPECITPRPQVIVIGRIDGRVRNDESPQIPHSDDGHANQKCCEPSSRARHGGACSRNRGCLHALSPNARECSRRLTVKFSGRAVRNFNAGAHLFPAPA
jgi:hypothetical protein